VHGLDLSSQWRQLREFAEFGTLGRLDSGRGEAVAFELDGLPLRNIPTRVHADRERCSLCEDQSSGIREVCSATITLECAVSYAAATKPEIRLAVIRRDAYSHAGEMPDRYQRMIESRVSAAGVPGADTCDRRLFSPSLRTRARRRVSHKLSIGNRRI